MKEEPEVRGQLREWIQQHDKRAAPGLTDETRILEEGIASSLDIVEVVLYIESLRGQEIDTEDIDADYARLQQEAVEIVTPIETEPWGERYFQMTDPNGVVYQLVQWVAPS